MKTMNNPAEVIIITKKEYEEQIPIKQLSRLCRDGYTAEYFGDHVYLVR